MQIRHLVTVAAILAWLAVPAPAAADCQPAGPLAQEIATAPLVFVGTVVEAGNRDGAPPVTLRVDEVWVGQVPEMVTIQGLSDDQSPVEDDRLWQVGVRYLVVPIFDADVLRDHMCTATTEWLGEYAALRPGNPPPATVAEGAFPFVPLVVGVALLGVMLAAFVGYHWAMRRKRAGGRP